MGRSISLKIMVYILLLLGAVTMILPFIWMISTSFKFDADVFSNRIEFIPSDVNWKNYINIWKMAPFHLFYLNTIKITLLVTLGRLIVSSMAAYSFARLRFKGRDTLFLIYLATMMVPYQVTIIPVYILMANINWVNTHWSLIVPPIFSAFGIFLLRQFFLGIPKEMEEAARIDGCGYVGIYWRVVLPLTMPAMTALAIFTFLGTWNDFMGPLIFLNSLDKYTISVGLASLRGMYQTEWTLLMAGSVLTIVPVIVLFIIAQKHFIEGITLQGSVKG